MQFIFASLQRPGARGIDSGTLRTLLADNGNRA
jgi:hypothetical protein